MLVVHWLGGHEGQVVLAAPGHTHIEVLGGCSRADYQHRLIGGEPLRLVDRHRIRQGHVVSDLTAGDAYLSSPVQRSEQQGVVGPAGQDLPAVPVAHPGPVVGDQSAVVVRGDHLVADADHLVADRDARRFYLSGVYPGGPGPHGETPATRRAP